MSSASPAATSAFGSGLTWFRDALTIAEQVKATAGQVYMVDLVNGVAATSYLQVFFRPSSEVTLGTSTPDFVLKVPTNAASGFTRTYCMTVPVGLFGLAGRAGTGLTVASTTGPANATTAAMGVTIVYM